MEMVDSKTWILTAYKSEDHTFSLDGHEGAVLAAKLNRSGDIVATGGIDKKICKYCRHCHFNDY